jgi:hypothetical protein
MEGCVPVLVLVTNVVGIGGVDRQFVGNFGNLAGKRIDEGKEWG